MKKYQLGLYEKAMPGDLTWPEKLLTAREGGYDYVEMSIDASEEKIARVYMPAADRDLLRAMTRRTGVPIGSLNDSALTKYALGSMNPETRQRGLEIGLMSISLARDLGVTIVMIPGYDVYYETSTEETRRFFEENLRILVDEAARQGIILAFETMENEFMNLIRKGMVYVNRIRSPYLQMYPDLGNMTNGALVHGESVSEDLEAGRGHIAALHLKETKPGIFREVPYGDGHVDFEAGVKKAWELGVRRYVTEFWYTGEENWKEILKENGAAFNALLMKQDPSQEETEES